MPESSRSPEDFPWDRGEVFKAGNGACLPPRKRLLAGLKQNGWLPSCPSRFQKVNEVSVPPAESADLREAEHDCAEIASASGSSICERGECKTVGELVSSSVKSKRAIKRRRSLSGLSDRENSVKGLQTGLLKSCSEGQIQEKVRGNEVSTEPLPPSKMEKSNVYHTREMVVAARAAAAKAAKAAADAKAIALEKAVAAAKAAEFARAALEAAAEAAENELLKHKPRRHLFASREHISVGEGMTGKRKSESLVLPFSHMPVNQGSGDSLEEKSEKKRILKWSSRSMGNKFDEKTGAGQRPSAALQPPDSDTVLARLKEDKGIHSCQVSFDVASFSNTIDKHEEAQQIGSAACPLPYAMDDETLARQLHRAMNSSPRISRSQTCLDFCRKSETLSYFTKVCPQIRYVQTRGCSSSRKKKQPHKDKPGVVNYRAGKGAFKTKSMTAINKALSMIQKGTEVKCRLMGSTRFTMDEHRGRLHQKEHFAKRDLNSTHVSLPNRHDKSCILSSNCDSNDDHKEDLKTKGITPHFHRYNHENGTVQKDDDIALQKSSSVSRQPSFRRRRRRLKTTMIETSPQGEGVKRLQKFISLCSADQPDRPSHLAFASTVSVFEKTICEELERSEENQDQLVMRHAGFITRGGVNEMAAIQSTQENLYGSKSTRAKHRSLQLTLCVEKPSPGQKILQVLANGSEEKEGFGKKFSLHLPSSATC